jgi:hypothetical protein
MRNERRIGGPLSESTGDRDLDEVERGGRVGVVVVVIYRSVEIESPGAADAAFGEELEVDAAPFVVVETVVEGVVELVETEVARATHVGAVEEGTVLTTFGHSTKAARYRVSRSFVDIGPPPRKT